MEWPPLPSSLDEYRGWAPSDASSSKTKIPRISSTISKEEMWEQYVSKRRPVVLQGLLPDPEWKGDRWLDLEYLRKTAGSVPVKIEPIHPTSGHFGTSARRKTVLFSEYIDILQDPKQSGKWYLTTQYDEEQADSAEEDDNDDSDTASKSTSRSLDESLHGAPGLQDGSSDDVVLGALDTEEEEKQPEIDKVLPAPTNALSNDFPSRPGLLSSLVLQQCNLWIGNSKEGKSSGLHHDFHDNLYMLLSGYKRFLLFPPSAHRYLHPRGQIEKVHPNGLIVYTAPGEAPSYVPGASSRLPIRPDGLVPSDAARWRRKARLRIKQEIDERAAASAGEGQRGKHQRKGKAKQTREQELAEQAFLQAEAELLLCRMVEEGIDPDANTSDDDDDDASDVSMDSAQMRRLLTAGGYQDVDESDKNEDALASGGEDDDDSNDEELLSFLATVPNEALPLARKAMEGDEAAYAELERYMAQLEETSDDEESDDDEDEVEDFRHLNGLGNISKRKRMSSGEDESLNEGDTGSNTDTVEASEIPFTKFDAEEEEEQADTEEERLLRELTDASCNGGSAARSKRAKRVKISDDRTEFLLAEAEGASDNEEDTDDSEELVEDSDDSGPPLFPEGDSGSEYSDIDDGEAELAKLLAMSNDQDVSVLPGEREEDDEPQSFSLIHPKTLHAHFGVADDPSQPFTKNGNHSRNDAKRAKSFASITRPSAEQGDDLLPRKGCPEPIEVFLKPGEMLYLPASWYHEVTSSSTAPFTKSKAEERKSEKATSSAVHMALNYWFHPPDALTFEEVMATTSSGQGRDESENVHVPGLRVEIGESATENLLGGTGTATRPYRDAEVWDEVARTVQEHIEMGRMEAPK